MKGFTNETAYELINEEGCEQLEEAYNFLTARQKKYIINKLESWESDIEKYIDEYKPVRRPRIKTPAQIVKKISYLSEWEKYKSIDPTEIPRARMLFTYKISSKKLTQFEGHLSARGSRITGYDKCVEKTLTDLTLLDRQKEAGNIILSLIHI